MPPFDKCCNRDARLCFRGEEHALRGTCGFRETLGHVERRYLPEIEPANFARFRPRLRFAGDELCCENGNHIALARKRNFTFAGFREDFDLD
jgi:hypothetical protein